ncbi:Hypothetical_protein [Hexamita inflata]|uniref:Hypothetical_protein n=1 Tax=Hexamita inflata TaxID=28002 RepID=A0AA86NDL5_9EUKA|nr:Hypothetical protein HINF_LOCUS4806 [Hexamita inflata]CAI9917164.1 Hypothetical protein HINF_LOCUS4809 [Hexamita inflata]CAI9919968.1 Hypothetical protein HINF_LOCUS7613 [Hexamita inflata]CAI9919971.1 Hypothetical protein HINF_LOCUS7616 [Hexamita inflata]CAI9971981.1 Hypothetical protein HINF_LOCUS59626 [Hexamita inflata]
MNQKLNLFHESVFAGTGLQRGQFSETSLAWLQILSSIARARKCPDFGQIQRQQFGIAIWIQSLCLTKLQVLPTGAKIPGYLAKFVLSQLRKVCSGIAKCL